MIRISTWILFYALVGSAVFAEKNLDLGIGDICSPLEDTCGSILECKPHDSELGGLVGGVVGECKLATWFIGVIFILVVAILASIIIPCICCPCCFLYKVITCKCCRS